jgi:HK97 gp10 family phage protein
MFRIKPNIKNARVFGGIKTLLKDINRSIHLSLFRIGKENVRHAKSLMLQNKTGKIYKINKLNHQSSAPGEAPAILTTNLFQNIDYAVSGHNQMEFGTRVPYGLALEEGTEKMSARPFLAPTIKDRQQDSYNEFVQNTRLVLGKMK